MVEWRVFGCGSASSGQFTQSSFEIADGNKTLQIDMGHGAIYRRCNHYQDIEEAVGSIHHILLTHCHPDHIVDLTRLYVARKFTPGFTPSGQIDLIGTEYTIQAAQRMLENVRLEQAFDEVFIPKIITLHQSFELNGFIVEARESIHTEGACGYSFKTPSGKTVGYTGDTGFSEALFSRWDDVDLLILECSFYDLETPYHLYLEQAATVAKHAAPEAILLVHFYPEMEKKSKTDIESEVARLYQGQTFLGYDGLIVRWDSDENHWHTERLFY